MLKYISRKQQQEYIAQAEHVSFSVLRLISVADYLQKKLKSKIESCIQAWKAKDMANTLQRVERDMSGLSSWKTEVKRPAARDKAKAIALFGNIQTRLSENRLKAWEPPRLLAPQVSRLEVALESDPDSRLLFIRNSTMTGEIFSKPRRPICADWMNIIGST